MLFEDNLQGHLHFTGATTLMQGPEVCFRHCGVFDRVDVKECSSLGLCATLMESGMHDFGLTLAPKEGFGDNTNNYVVLSPLPCALTRKHEYCARSYFSLVPNCYNMYIADPRNIA